MGNQRLEREKRDTLQADRHCDYGNFLTLADVDNFNNIFYEYEKDEVLAFVEFKNDNEKITPEGKKGLAKLEKPFWISVIYRHHPGSKNPIYICYFEIPLNKLAYNLLGSPRFWSEAEYVEFLYSLRSSKYDLTDILSKCSVKVWKETAKLPNLDTAMKQWLLEIYTAMGVPAEDYKKLCQ